MNTGDLREALRRDADLAGRPPSDLLHRVADLRRRSRRRRATVLAGLVAIAVAVAGVSVLDGARSQGGGADQAAVVDLDFGAGAGADTEGSAAAYRKAIAEAGAAAARAIAPASLVEFLPTVRYRGPDGALVTLSDAVVVGSVTSVGPGRAYYWPADDEGGRGVEVPFDDPRAMSRTIRAEVAVTEVLAGEVSQDSIVVGLPWAAGTPFEVAAEGLPALGDLVLFLREQPPVHDDDPGLWSVAEDGAVLAEVEPDGRLTFPAVGPDRAEQWRAATPTLDSLRAAARQPARVLPLETLED